MPTTDARALAVDARMSTDGGIEKGWANCEVDKDCIGVTSPCGDTFVNKKFKDVAASSWKAICTKRDDESSGAMEKRSVPKCRAGRCSPGDGAGTVLGADSNGN